MPSNLHIISGNHLESLVDGLAAAVKTRPAEGISDPLAPETVVVQSKGMQRWISLALANRNGICANFEFPFPNAFLEKTFSKAFGQFPESDAFSRPTMTFQIMKLMDDLKNHPALAPILSYLSVNASPLKRFQLAAKVADVFDQYLVFRPDIIAGWETDPNPEIKPDIAWQRLLWRQLRDRTNELHRADLQKRLIRRLKDNTRTVPNLPHRVSVFGISYLPLFHLQVLDALAFRIPVHLFLLNPCRQYWSDIVSERRMSRIRAKNKTASAPQATLYMEKGNRLLSSWGHQGRQFFSLAQEMEGGILDLFEDNPQQTVLGNIQQDILDLKDRSLSETSQQVEVDDSLQIHVCHSPMREVEVLHDRLLGILDADSDIHPSDILVMTPDIGRYAPFIHAVFGRSTKESSNMIPFTVADQSVPRESRIADAFLRVLDLIDGRFEASRIVSLLEYSAIRKRFGIENGDLPQIESWIYETNIRWGWDDNHRKKFGLPRFKENTWRMGLDRLLLGYAMSTGPDELYAGIAPHHGVEGSQSTVLGAFIHFCESLKLLLDRIPVRAGLRRWSITLNAMLEVLFKADDESTRDIQMLRTIIEQLERSNHCIQGSPSITFDVMRQFIGDQLNQNSFGTGFLGGGVTFCAMLPMRSIPSKVICLLGLQHDTFPQDLREPGFNLIAADPRPGDRSKRDDDKYLFLEALLSARKIFYISYVGRDIQDNSTKPPSVLVNELLEYAREDIGVKCEDLIIDHPLQPFSAAYFDPDQPKLFSYSKENLEAGQNLDAPAASVPFFGAPISEPQDSWRLCDIDQLCRFFSHPTRYLMEQRLGIVFWDTLSAPIADTETFNLAPLEFYKVSQDLLSGLEEGTDPTDHFHALQAAGRLPHGKVGLAVYDILRNEVETFSNTLDRLVPGHAPRQHPLDIELTPFHIGGQLNSIYPESMAIYRFANLRPSDLLSAYIRHLALNMLGQTDLPATTRLICKDAVWEFAAVKDPQEALHTYLKIYWQGLQAPLPFFSRASFAYAEKIVLKGRPEGDALKEAFKKWRGGYFQRGESDDPYHLRCFAEKEPIDDRRFASLAIEIYAPLLAAGRQLSTGSHGTRLQAEGST